jgi:peptidoglycan/LPS O-acetylase OafA/YrhL
LQRSELSPAQASYLDFLRALGALMVLFGHAAEYFLPTSFLANGVAQTLGVYIFFLISGFLISLSVLQKLYSPSYGFGDYFCDRFFRIYAAFVPALILVVVLDALTVSEPTYLWRRDYNVQTFVGNLLMLQDFPLFQVLRRLGMGNEPWMIASFGSARPFWTISIEWWLYMAFGGIMFFIVRRGGEISRLGLLALCLVSIEPLYHLVGGYGQCLTMVWLVGSAMAFVFHSLPALRARWPRLGDDRLRRFAAMAALAGIVFMAGRIAGKPQLVMERGALYELQFAVFLAMLIFGALFALTGVRRAGPAAIVGFIAGYSYSLYLIHHSIVELLWVKRPDLIGSHAAFWGVIVLSNLAAIVFWWAFERHHRQMAKAARAWLARRRSEALTA